MTTWEDLKDLARRQQERRGSAGATRKRRSGPDRGPLCDGEKKQFSSSRAAKYAARTVSDVAGENLHPYFCRTCRAWHIGHRSQRRMKRRLRKDLR